MNRVTVELWLWLGEDLKGHFESPSETRSVREEHVKEGTILRELLCDLASRYEPIEKQVFDIRKRMLRPGLTATYNQRVIPPDEFYKQVLRNGDKITIFQMYTGG
jgi:sulfur carrier protein ThiS